MNPLQALGITPARTSPHVASKRGHRHITDVAQDRPARIARAQAWSAETGRPVPPHLRWRRPLRPASPLPIGDRLLATPAQVRRARHKHGRLELEIVLGYDPGKREADRVTRARRRKRLRQAQHILARTVPAGPLQKTRGGLGRRPKRVVESAPSVYVRDEGQAVFDAARHAGPGLALANPRAVIKIVVS